MWSFHIFPPFFATQYTVRSYIRDSAGTIMYQRTYAKISDLGEQIFRIRSSQVLLLLRTRYHSKRQYYSLFFLWSRQPPDPGLQCCSSELCSSSQHSRKRITTNQEADSIVNDAKIVDHITTQMPLEGRAENIPEPKWSRPMDIPATRSVNRRWRVA